MGSGHPAFSQTLWHRDHMPAVDFTVEQLVAVMAAVVGPSTRIAYPLSPRLDPLKSALAKLDPALVPKRRAQRPPLPEGEARSRDDRRGGGGRRGRQPAPER